MRTYLLLPILSVLPVTRLTSAYPATPTGTNTTTANSRCIVPSANTGATLCIIKGIINNSATALQRRYILKAMLCRHKAISKSTGAARVGNIRNCHEACRGSGIGNIPAFKESTPLATTESPTSSASAVQVAVRSKCTGESRYSGQHGSQVEYPRLARGGRSQHARRILREAIARVKGCSDQLRSKIDQGHGDRRVQGTYSCLPERGRAHARLFHLSSYAPACSKFPQMDGPSGATLTRAS